MILAKGSGDLASAPLTVAPKRPMYIVDRVGGPDQRRLSEMGFIEGAKVEVVNRASGDMMVVRIGGTRLALARGMADNVFVK